MPYTQPNGDAIEFLFGDGGYAAPAGDLIVFEFGATPPPPNACMLDLQWDTVAPSLPVCALNLQWVTEARVEQSSSLDLQWIGAAPTARESALDLQWETERADAELVLLDLQWSTSGPADAIGALDVQWATEIGVGTALLDLQWATLVPGMAESSIGFEWQTEGTPAGTALLDAQWETIGATAELSILDCEFEALGIAESIAFLDIEWGTLTPMEATSFLDLQWAFLDYVDQAVQIVYQDAVAAAVEINAPIGLGDVAQGVSLRSDLLTAVVQMVVLTSAMGDVEQAVELDASILDTVVQACAIDSPILSDVAAAVDIDSPIRDTDDVMAELVIVSPILGDSEVITLAQQTLVIRGEAVPLASVDISFDEGQFAWTCEAQLLDPRQYAIFNADDEFSVMLGAETYAFIVEGKRMARELGDEAPRMQASIAGISPTVRYSTPRAKRITKTWTSAALASAVAAELLPGVPIDWRIVDWSIPAHRLAAQDESPIDILSRIAAAAGGLVETNPNGSLYVRYAYPVPVADYATMAPDQSYSDIADRFSVSEGYAANELINRIRILDATPGAYEDVIEFEADRLNPAIGTLRVWPSPWRETFFIEHTSLPIVSIARVGIETLEQIETVEVLRGQGSVRYPIDAILSVDWLYVNLGGITFTPDQRNFESTSTTASESLVRITYRTRFIEYRAVAFDGAEVQFLVKEPALG